MQDRKAVPKSRKRRSPYVNFAVFDCRLRNWSRTQRLLCKLKSAGLIAKPQQPSGWLRSRAKAACPTTSWPGRSLTSCMSDYQLAR